MSHDVLKETVSCDSLPARCMAWFYDACRDVPVHVLVLLCMTWFHGTCSVCSVCICIAWCTAYVSIAWRVCNVQSECEWCGEPNFHSTIFSFLFYWSHILRTVTSFATHLWSDDLLSLGLFVCSSVYMCARASRGVAWPDDAISIAGNFYLSGWPAPRCHDDPFIDEDCGWKLCWSTWKPRARRSGEWLVFASCFFIPFLPLSYFPVFVWRCCTYATHCPNFTSVALRRAVIKANKMKKTYIFIHKNIHCVQYTT